MTSQTIHLTTDAANEIQKTMRAMNDADVNGEMYFTSGYDLACAALRNHNVPIELLDSSCRNRMIDFATYIYAGCPSHMLY